MTTPPPHDPGVDPEAEGIPDLQDGSPEQEQAVDPQQLPVPGDEPTAVTEERPTFNEQREGPPLDERLAEEEPEETDVLPDEEVPSDAPAAEAGEEEPAGLLIDEPDPDAPRNQDVYSEAGTTRGLSAAEEAVHVTSEEQALDEERADERIARDES